MVKIISFDTETTGLPSNIKNIDEITLKMWENKYADTWPYIVQLSYITYDTDTNENNTYDIYIDLPKNVVEKTLENEKTHIMVLKAVNTGLHNKRTPIKEALLQFMEHFAECDVCVGQSVLYDRKMLLAELMRLYKKSHNGKVHEYLNMLYDEKSKFYCTLKNSKNIIKIYYPEKYNLHFKKNRTSYKIPSLKELYFVLFGYAPIDTSLHNALIDSVVCLRVFYRLWFLGARNNTYKKINHFCGTGEPDIYKKDKGEAISAMIESITPEGIDPKGGYTNGLTICEPISLSVISYGIDNNISIEAAKRFFNKKKSRKHKKNIYNKNKKTRKHHI